MKAFTRILLALLLLPLPMLAADDAAQQLVITSKDGTTVAYTFAEEPKVSFTDTELVVTSKDATVSYQLSNMALITYKLGTATGITNIASGETTFRMDGSALVFPSLAAGSKVTVSTTAGAVVLSKKISTAGKYSFPLSELANGVYMVSVNGQTYKIVKK